MKSLIAIIVFASLSAQAQLANLPDTNSEVAIGRVKLYKSVQPISWLQPTAFESQFECTSGSGSHRSCSIKVFNRLNEEEKSKLDRMIQSERLNVVPFSSIDNQVVSGVRESFADLPTGLSGQTQYAGTLQMSDGRFPYASYVFRVPKEQGDELLNQYQIGSLGRFHTQFNVQTQKTEMYLGFADGKCLKDTLMTARDQDLYKYQVNRIIDQAMRNCSLKMLNWDQDEVVGYIRPRLRELFFEYQGWLKYGLNANEVSRIERAFPVNNVVSRPTVLRCQVELDLTANAEPRTTCEEAK